MGTRGPGMRAGLLSTHCKTLPSAPFPHTQGLRGALLCQTHSTHSPCALRASHQVGTAPQYWVKP